MDKVDIPIKFRVITALCGLLFGAVCIIVMLVKGLSIWMTVPMWLAVALAVVSAFSMAIVYALEQRKKRKE